MLDWLLSFRIDRAVKSLGSVALALSKRNEKLYKKKFEEQKIIQEKKEKVQGYGEQIKTNESLASNFDTMAETLKKQIE